MAEQLSNTKEATNTSTIGDSGSRDGETENAGGEERDFQDGDEIHRHRNHIVGVSHDKIDVELSASERKRPNIGDDDPLPKLPLKKARTAYFIFADEKRDELKQLYKGEGVAKLARATGELWSALDSLERKKYELKACEERERLSNDRKRLKDAGLLPEPTSRIGSDWENGDDDLILPLGRIRKICKLDPDVKGISKESILLIAKATELFCVKLGNECITMAQMSNRRKLLPEDVVEVCSMKERFMFLNDDLKDLAREQVRDKNQKYKDDVKVGTIDNSSDGKVAPTGSLLSYFSKG